MSGGIDKAAVERLAKQLNTAMLYMEDGCPTDIADEAAAALARREDGLRLVLYEVSKGPSPGEQMRHWIEHCMRLARALKRSGKETG